MLWKVTIDDIFDHLLCDPKVQKLKEYDTVEFNRRYGGSQTQGLIELDGFNMILIDAECGITITRYDEDEPCEFTEPEGLDEACIHIKHYLEFGELPNGEPI